MATILLHYIVEHKDRLKKHVHRGYIVGPAEVYKMFKRENVDDDSVSIIDIHKPRAPKTRQPEIRNVLEYVANNGWYPGAYYETMKKLGHERESAERAFFRSKEELQLIEPEYLSFSGTSISNNNSGQFILTSKGRYYLIYLSRQKMYLHVYGKAPRTKSIAKYQDLLTGHIIDCLRNIYVLVYFADNYVDLQKRQFYNFFIEINPELSKRLSESKPETPAFALNLDIKGFNTLLDLLTIQTTELDKESKPVVGGTKTARRSYYRFYKNNLRNILKDKYGLLDFEKDLVMYEEIYIDFLVSQKITIKPEIIKQREEDREQYE